MLGVFFQSKNYRKTISQQAAAGKIGVGRKRGILGGEVVILVADETGKIFRTSKMTGATVFSRFQDADEFNGMTVYEILEHVDGDTKKHHIRSACEQIVSRI